jgi:hypothetical protein
VEEMTLDELGEKYKSGNSETSSDKLDSVAKKYKPSQIKVEGFGNKTSDFDPTTSMSGPERVAAGWGKSIVDMGRGAGQLLGMTSFQDVKDSNARDKKLMDTSGGFWGNVGGSIANTLALGGAAGAGIRAAAPAMSAFAPNIGNLMRTASVVAPKTIPGAAGAGAAMGLMAPAEDFMGKATNVGVGAAASAALPLAVQGGKALGAAAEPFYQGGRDRIIGRALTDAAGDAAPQALAGLRNPAQYVPGSMPTVGEAAGVPSIAALQRAASATEPNVVNEMVSRASANDLARKGLLEEMAGTQGAREMFGASRQTAADDLYKAAYAAGTDLRRDATTGQFLTKAQQAGRKAEITKLMRVPAMQQAAADAKILMQNEMKNVGDPTGSVQGLDYMRRALSDNIGKTQGNEQRVLIGLRDRLDTTLNAISPKYAEARVTFSEMSKPINEMDTAAEILKRGTNNKNETLTLSQFRKAATDETAQGATGFKKATLDKVMSPENLSKLDAIKNDLARADFAQNAGRGVGSDTVQKLSYSNIINQAGIPNWLRGGIGGFAGNLAGQAGNMAYSNANKQLASQLAITMMTPQEAARMMLLGQPNPTAQALQGLLSRGGASIGLMAPGLLAANQ